MKKTSEQIEAEFAALPNWSRRIATVILTIIGPLFVLVSVVWEFLIQIVRAFHYAYLEARICWDDYLRDIKKMWRVW